MNKNFVNPNNNEQYKYTKIIVPISLIESPSDFKDCRYFLDINCSDFRQEYRYIGTHKIEDICFSRVKKACCESNNIAEWKLEIQITGKKSEKEIIDILNELCELLSLRVLQYYKHFQNCGFEGFSYDRTHLEIKYAFEDKVYNDAAFIMSGCRIEMSTISSLDNKVFKLPKKAVTKSDFSNKLIASFLKALKCKDKISRYILLYYLFEIMYGTDEYQELKKQYEETIKKSNSSKNKCNKNYSDKKRSEILFQYLQQEFALKEYSSFGKKITLEKSVLENIITTRNALTHRGDLSKVSELMYNHMIPILQEIITHISK